MVERTNKAEIRPGDQSEKAESSRGKPLCFAQTERKRERERERDRQTDRQTEIDRQRQRDRDRELGLVTTSYDHNLIKPPEPNSESTKC